MCLLSSAFANGLSIISFLGTVAIALSLAEIASIWPTAGGQYHWVAVLAPRNARVTASWFTGWISVGGQIVLTASAAFAAGLQLQALITLNQPETYVPKRWQGMLFYWLVLLYAAAVNILGSKILPHTNLASGEWHVVHAMRIGQLLCTKLYISLTLLRGLAYRRLSRHCHHSRSDGSQTLCPLCVCRSLELQRLGQRWNRMARWTSQLGLSLPRVIPFPPFSAYDSVSEQGLMID